jgi:hypothetical protein
MKEHDHGEGFFLNASDMDVCNELNMLWMRKHKTKWSGCIDYSK